MKFKGLVTLLFSGFVGSSLLGAPPSHEVTAKVIAAELVITNNTTKEIYYAVFEMDVLKRIEWGPIFSDENRIGPKKSVRLPARPSDFKPSGKAVIYWWHKNTNLIDKKHAEPDVIRSFIVKIK